MLTFLFHESKGHPFEIKIIGFRLNLVLILQFFFAMIHIYNKDQSVCVCMFAIERKITSVN